MTNILSFVVVVLLSLKNATESYGEKFFSFSNIWSMGGLIMPKATNYKKRMVTPIKRCYLVNENDDYARPSPSPCKFPKTNPRFKVPGSSSTSSSNSDQPNKMRRLLHGLKNFGIKGELYISMLVQRRLLTITIDQARNLIPPDGSSCCKCYVRVSLVPDDEKRSQCKTEQVCYSNRPVYNQTFTIELLPEDYDKRILISMWHRPTSFDRSVFLGCMSFNVRHLARSRKQTDGWYFLLSPSYGKRKHLAVHKVTMLTFYGSLDKSNDRKTTTTPVTSAIE